MAQIIEIESSYDEFDRTSFEFKKVKATEANASLWNLYSLLWDKDFNELFKECERLFNNMSDPNFKAFIIQAAISATEILFDLDLRKRWLRLWNHMDSLSDCTYAQYLYYTHRGNSLYFEGNPTESIKFWNKGIEVCKTINYTRGIFRLQFFVGKAHEDLGFIGPARTNYQSSLLLANSRKAIRFSERIELQLKKSNGVQQYLFNQTQFEIFDMIKDGKIKKAKKLSLYHCRCRRFENREWGAESEWILLAWIAAAEKKVNRIFILLDFMDSDYTKWITLSTIQDLVPDLFLLDKRFEHNLYLLKTHQLNFSTESKSVPSVDILDGEIEKLIILLKSNKNGISKEEICLQLWNYTYDPSIHDPRIYVVISKIRKFFGSKNSVINSYGGIYKINSLLS